MGTLDESLRTSREAADQLLAAADAAGTRWATPRAPGKWSPAQVVEHVARALEQSALEIAGEPTLFPRFPRILRPLVRWIFFGRVLRMETFPRGARTNRPMDPESGPATPAEARVRIDTAVRALEKAARDRAGAADWLDTSVFGRVPLDAYVRFQAIHTRHHRRQLDAGA